MIWFRVRSLNVHSIHSIHSVGTIFAAGDDDDKKLWRDLRVSLGLYLENIFYQMFFKNQSKSSEVFGFLKYAGHFKFMV